MSDPASELLESLAAEPQPDGTRARLLRAAAEAIGEGGCAAASVTAIAERAGVANGALYRHFPSKADLVVELIRRAGELELEAMYAAAAEHERWLDRLDAVLRTYAARALARPQLTWALVYEPVDPLVDAERLAFRRHYREQMAQLVEQAIATGEIPPQDPGLAASAIVGAIAEALVGPTSPAAAAGIRQDELIDGIIAFCRRAIGAAQG